jgi:hypothetical protein
MKQIEALEERRVNGSGTRLRVRVQNTNTAD